MSAEEQETRARIDQVLADREAEHEKIEADIRDLTERGAPEALLDAMRENAVNLGRIIDELRRAR
jgi:hypothetical protein